MKKFLLVSLSAFLIFGQALMAQEIYISPNPVYKEGVFPGDFEGVGYSDFFNDSDSDLNFTWQVSVVQMTEGWDVAVCDVIQCYLPSVSTQPFDLSAGTSGSMDVHVYPNGIDGSAIIEVEVYQTNDTTNTTTGTYYFNQVLGLTEKFSEAIKVYPNPTQDYITIDNSENLVSSLELYNVSGKMVLSTNLNGKNKISLQDLRAGNYILKLVDVNANIVSTNLVVKQ